MSKRKDRKRVAALYASVTQRARAALPDDEDSATAARGPEGGHADAPVDPGVLAASRELSCLVAVPAGRPRELPRMKKFRFQLLHQWLIEHVAPCRVADVGGGKGLLAYLLQQSGWDATVIDPIRQALPVKYKDLAADRQVRIPETERVPRIDRAFEPGMARDFELLVAMHAHGCTIQLIDAAARHGRDAILLPCCIIHEPIVPPPGVHWLQCVVDHATRQGLRVEPFRLNFKGQNIGLHLRSPGAVTDEDSEG